MPLFWGHGCTITCRGLLSWGKSAKMMLTFYGACYRLLLTTVRSVVLILPGNLTYSNFLLVSGSYRTHSIVNPRNVICSQTACLWLKLGMWMWKRSNSGIRRHTLTPEVQFRISASTLFFRNEKKKIWVNGYIEWNMKGMKYWMKGKMKMTQDCPWWFGSTSRWNV